MSLKQYLPSCRSIARSWLDTGFPSLPNLKTNRSHSFAATGDEAANT
jgi:hypothetical protein